MIRNCFKLAQSGAALRNVRNPMTGLRGFASKATKAPVRVTVTGGSGQIGYALLFRIASGAMLGNDQPVILQCLELEPAMKALEGVAMELNDCAFPLLKGIVQTSKSEKAFEGADYALLVGARPRTKGMERGDLLKANANIFSEQGKAINKVANKSIKVLVVGNPANTNAMITSHFAPQINPRQITAMTRLDHNRGLAQISAKLDVGVEEIQRFAIWGNHSATQFPDISNALISKETPTFDAKAPRDPKKKWVSEQINDMKWVKEVFIPAVQQRGAAIINARGFSSAASAANAAIDHMRDWVHGTHGQWTSMAVPSEKNYGMDNGIWFSYPVICSNGDYKVVTDVVHSDFNKERLEITRKELVAERDELASLLK